MPKSLTIRILGSTEILLDDSPVTDFDSRKVTAILLYLSSTGRTYPREVLANLRFALSSLRNSLVEFVDITRDSVGLSLAKRLQYFDS